VAVAILSKDWCFSTVASTLATALIIGLLDSLVLERVIRDWSMGRRIQVILALLVCGSFLACFAGTGNRLFTRVFGVSPPPGVSELAIDSASIGLSGDQAILMRFKADQATIERLVQHRGFVVDKETMTIWSQQMGKQWPWLWERAFSNFTIHGGRAWKNVEPMPDPVLFVHEHCEGIATITAKMLWDRASGRTYLLYLN